MNEAVRLEHVYKNYGNKEILKDISFDIHNGEIFGLLGPSGSGKTTIVKTISGIELATKGNVEVLNKIMPDRDVLIDIGYMGQSDALYEDLTGKENLMFFAALYNIRKNKKQRINELMEILDLKDALNKKVNQYSGGMKKRLSLAAAILHNPRLLILDEPTVGIDPVLRKSIWEKFYEMKASGTTLIVTTHIMEEIDKCDRAALIRNGKIIAIDDVNNLKNRTKSGKIEELFFEKEQD